MLETNQISRGFCNDGSVGGRKVAGQVSTRRVELGWWRIECLMGGYIHLRIKDAGRRLNNADRFIVDGNSVEGILAVLQDGYELQAHILRVHLSAEAVGDGLRLARGDLDRVALGSQVAEDVRLWASILDERAANDGNANWLGLVVCDVDNGLGCVPIDELDTENLRLREFGGDGDLQVGRLGRFGNLLDVLNLVVQC